MRMKFSFLSLLIVGALFVPAIALAQQDEDVRGAFMTSRPKASAKDSGTKTTPTARPSRRHPKPSGTSSSGTNGNGAPSSTGNTSTKLNVPRLGLGLTLFMRDSNGLAVRTDPSHDFHKGDHVRFLVETNTDGYLYLFNTTDNGAPVMIYPDAELDEAGNYFQAHVPFEIPSSLASEERLKWLTFDEHGGAEKLYFVFTREPLTAVPIEDDLIAFNGNGGKRFAGKNKIQFLRAAVFVKRQPLQSLFRSQARGNLKRYVCLKVVASFVQLSIRVDHYRRSIVGGVEKIQIPIGIGLNQKPDVIAFVKVVRRIRSDSQAIRVAHE